MKHWRMRTTLMVSLLAVSLGLTAVCLLIIRFSVEREIRNGLDSDLGHSLSTFRNMEGQHNLMLARESSLLADLPSLKALMSTQDRRTIQDGSTTFWTTSGGDFFALLSSQGDLFTYSNRGAALDDAQVSQGLRACMLHLEDICTIAFSKSLYELSLQPLYFGPPGNGSELGYVVIGYAIDQQVAHQLSEVASADVAFLIDGDVSATTLPSDRLPDLRRSSSVLDSTRASPQALQLGREVYMAAASKLPSVGVSSMRNGHVELIVLKSYDRASLYLRRVNQWILVLGICALLIGILLAMSISRTVTKPLEALVAGTRALGQGNFNYRLNTEGAIEVRELGSAFDRMRGELQRTQQELLESDRLATIGRMASSVSHDLRHHLSAIYANAEFMSLEHAGLEDRRDLLLEIKDGVQGMTDLIESLLFFSHNGHVLHLQHESLAQLLERTVHNVRQHPECRKVQILVEQLDPAEASVDTVKLSRALYNLLLNACQAAAAGAVAPVVTVVLSEEDEKICIAISDTGSGVPPSIRDTLFQPFVSLGKVNGTGLGLTVAQHIVQEHGGEITLKESTLGKTVFSILLYKKALHALDRLNATNAAYAAPKRAERFNEEELAFSQELP
jgi:signal transduction histidine kinase